MVYTPSTIACLRKTTRIIDVNHNNAITDASLTKVGICAAFIKISQGTHPDPEARNNYQLLQRTGRKAGGYAFSEPSCVSKPLDQAKFFYAQTLRTLNRAWTPDFPLVLDLEPDEKYGKMTIPEAEEFVRYFVGNIGYYVMLYGGGGLLRDAMETDNRYANSILHRCPLWLADPRTNWRMIKGWDSFALRQSAEDHEEPGWDYNQVVLPASYTGDEISYIHNNWSTLFMAKV